MGGMFAMTAGALIVAACSSDTAADKDLPSTKKDSGKTTGSDDNSGTDTTGDDTDGSVVKKDAAVEEETCKTAKLRATDSLFCQWQQTPPDGGFAPDCKSGETCCLQQFDYKDKVKSTCEARGTTCPTGTKAWECSDTSQCGGKKCCLGVADPTKNDGGVSIGTKTGCPATDIYAFNEAPTVCKTSCDTGEIEITQACGDGGVPTAVRANSYDLAYCKH